LTRLVSAHSRECRHRPSSGQQTLTLLHSLRQRTEPRRAFKDGRPSSGLPTPSAQHGLSSADADGAELATALDAAAKIEDDADEAPAQTGISWSARDLVDSVDTGFQIATLQGPMCAEPVQGLAYFVERVEVDKEVAQKEGGELQAP